MEKNNFDIEKMSQEIGISVVNIKIKFGLPLEGVCKANTVEEAKEAYYNAPSGSEAQVLAYDRWNELSLLKAKKITTIEEAREIYNSTDCFSKVRDFISVKWIELVTTAKEARSAYYIAPSSLKFIAFKKWVGFVTTIEEAKEAYESASVNSNSEAKAFALKKWNKLSIIKAKKAVTIDEARSAYYSALSDSEAQAFAFKKWDRLSLREAKKSTTTEEAMEDYNYAPDGSRASKARAFAKKKLNEFFLIEVEEATTIEELKRMAFHSSPYDCEIITLVFKKWAEFATTIEEAKKAYKSATGGSKAQDFVLRKIATFYGWKN